MGGIRIIYAPNSRLSVSVPGSSNEFRTDRRKSSVQYLEILKPTKGSDQLQICSRLPITLTQKGYNKHLSAVAATSAKEYRNLVIQLKRSGKLWEDPDFPATDSSIGDVPGLNQNVDWIRPKEITINPVFFDNIASRFDIEQGKLGDCWLLAVISSISGYPALFNHIVPTDQQAMQGPDYVGAFHFKFWQFGEWVDVIVDDRLPVYRGTRRLVFMHSYEESVFWSALLEKAYAKLRGSYACLNEGLQSDAMEDLTGGLAEIIDLHRDKRPPDLLKRMTIYVDRCCLMGCSIESGKPGEKLANGLFTGHAYSITGVNHVNYEGAQQYLVRCRNPWGANYEWNGPWSDGAKEWKEVDRLEKLSLNVKFCNDGEFWMSYEDFLGNFTRMFVCYFGQSSMKASEQVRGRKRLEESIFYGRWEKHVNAGGCINHRATYATNPQYRFTVEHSDPDSPNKKTLVFIGLMQRGSHSQDKNLLGIGFMLYKVDSRQKSLLRRSYLLSRPPIGRSDFAETREVAGRFELDPGSYVVIPSTFKPNQEAEFLLRILCLVLVSDMQLDEEDSHKGIAPEVVTYLRARPTPPNEDEEIRKKFYELADPKTGAIGWTKLRKLLNASTLKDISGFHGFDKEFCRSALASVDQNLTGRIVFAEFNEIWRELKDWKGIFQKFDVQRKGYLETHEFREALDTAGYSVSNKLLSALIHRYKDPEFPGISYEDYLLCVVRLRTAFETFNGQPETELCERMFGNNDYLRLSISM